VIRTEIRTAIRTSREQKGSHTSNLVRDTFSSDTDTDLRHTTSTTATSTAAVAATIVSGAAGTATAATAAAVMCGLISDSSACQCSTHYLIC
jgi:hypothetical protein